MILRSLFTLVTLIFVLAFNSSARAGLIMCNDTGIELTVAAGWYVAPGWQSSGWQNIKPRSCALSIVGSLSNNRYVYYYAAGGSLIWDGNNGESGSWFCANHNKEFAYYRVTPCEGYQFRQIDTGGSEQYIYRLTETTTAPETAALNCAGEASRGRDPFISCWTRQVATEKQRKILDCVRTTDTAASLSVCAAKNYIDPAAAKAADCSLKYSQDNSTVAFAQCIMDGQLGQREASLVNCAIHNRGSYAALGMCAVGAQLSPEQRRLYDCIAQNMNDYRAAGICVAGSNLSEDQRRIANCVMQNRGSYVQMGVCAAGGGLTSEQQVFTQCAISTGGQPYAFAGCVGAQLTLNELQKCIDQGIGGSGCFGDNNTAVKSMKNAWKDVTEGPGPSNDLVSRDGFVGRNLENARKDITEGPGPGNELFGEQGTVGRGLEDIRKSAPPPLELGTIGGARVCIPWC